MDADKLNSVRPKPRLVTAEAVKFGKRLRELLQAREEALSIAEFAEQIGVTADMARKYLRGHSVPPLHEWPRIAWVLGQPTANDLLPNLPARKPN